MKKIVLALLILSSSATIYAQNSFWSNPDYGVNLNLNLPVIKPISSDTLSMKTEFGGGIFFEFGYKKNWGFQPSISYDRITYNHNILQQTTQTQIANLGLSSFYKPKNMEGTRLFFGAQTSFGVATHTETLDGSKAGGVRKEKIELVNPNDLILMAGLSFEFKKHMSLNIAYKEAVYSIPSSSDYNGIADHLQIGFQFKFNQIKERTSVVPQSQITQYAKKLRDDGFLLIVLNSYNKELNNLTEEDAKYSKIMEAKKMQLETVKNHYKFSEYIICYDTELDNIRKGDYSSKNIYKSENLIHSGSIPEYYLIARMGDFFVDLNQSPRSGFFIYDMDMNLMKDPFPYFTPFMGLESYMNNAQRIEVMLMKVNSALKLLYQES